jgi:hypothetical protein
MADAALRRRGWRCGGSCAASGVVESLAATGGRQGAGPEVRTCLLTMRPRDRTLTHPGQLRSALRRGDLPQAKNPTRSRLASLATGRHRPEIRVGDPGSPLEREAESDRKSVLSVHRRTGQTESPSPLRPSSGTQPAGSGHALRAGTAQPVLADTGSAVVNPGGQHPRVWFREGRHGSARADGLPGLARKVVRDGSRMDSLTRSGVSRWTAGREWW